MQKTNFPVEILIHDDASTDGTADIIREYEAQYPDIIKPIYQTENQYSKGIKISQVYQFPRAKGKYIALCEGDDYWIDPYKLQKQVDFLEANPEYGMVHTDFNTYNIKTKEYKKNVIASLQPKIEWQEGNKFVKYYISGYTKIITCTVCFRKSVYDEFIDKNDFNKIKIFGDLVLFCTIGGHSKVKYFNKSTAGKNNLIESATNSENYKKKIDVYYSMMDGFIYFGKKYNIDESFYKKQIKKNIFCIMKIAIKNRDYNEFKNTLNNDRIKINYKIFYNILFLLFPFFKPILYLKKKF